MHTFVKSFQGQYKGGRNGTCDFRDLIFDWDIIMRYKSLFTKTLDTHYFDINTKLLVPHMVLILYVCYALAKKTSIIQFLIRKYEHLQRCMQAASTTYQAEQMWKLSLILNFCQTD